MSEKILFIINPNAGKRDVEDLPELIQQHLDFNRFESKIVFTAYAGHAPKLVEEHSGFDVYVAVGGDGTVNEVAAAVKASSGALAIIPKGSGNGFARYIGMPMDPVKAIDYINKGKALRMDMGSIDGKYFLATCGIGFDAEVAVDFAQRNHRGLKNYLKAILHLYKSYPGFTAQIRIDEGEVQEVSGWIITAGNGNQWGNNAFICPEADAQDGLLNLTWVREKISWLEAPYFAYLLFTRKLDRHGKVSTLKFSTMQIANYEGAMHFDGEPSAIKTRVMIASHPKAIQIWKVV